MKDKFEIKSSRLLEVTDDVDIVLALVWSSTINDLKAEFPYYDELILLFAL